jgi:hypothetical protein
MGSCIGQKKKSGTHMRWEQDPFSNTYTERARASVFFLGKKKISRKWKMHKVKNQIELLGR